MKRTLLATIPVLMVLALVGCSKQDNQATDQANVQALLDAAQYTAEGSTVPQDDGEILGVAAVSALEIPAPNDSTIPFVRFDRRLVRPVIRNDEIAVSGDTATVLMTAGVTGDFFTTADTGRQFTAFRRPIADTAIRTIKLVRDTTRPRGWEIVSLTPWDIYTVGAARPITIDEVKIEASPSGKSWVITDPTALLTKDQLPTFDPGDTVTVTVTVSGDSTWAFLHHGVRHDRHLRGPHDRQPFYQPSPNLFRGTWVVMGDECWSRGNPGVRHGAVDVISYASLFAQDSTTAFSDHVWALPYIVKKPNEFIPPDE